jgi:hypothetical protein
MRMVAAVESIRGSNQPLVSVILEIAEIFGDRKIGRGLLLLELESKTHDEKLASTD